MSKDGTFVYAPDIAVYVKTDKGVLDLSSDIIRFSLTRNVNDVSTFSCSLSNKYNKYDRTIGRMSRIVVFLKRLRWMQEFSGYVSTVPYLTVVPGNVELTANCTLIRLKRIYWDSGTPEAVQMLPYFDEAGSKVQDGGAAKSMVKLLTKVGDWNPKQIHIQKIPNKFINHAAKLQSKSVIGADARIAAMMGINLDTDGFTSGEKNPTGGSGGSGSASNGSGGGRGAVPANLTGVGTGSTGSSQNSPAPLEITADAGSPEWGEKYWGPGWPTQSPHQVTMEFCGRAITVHKDAAKMFAWLSNEFETKAPAYAKKIKNSADTGAFVNRAIGGTNVASNHSFGTALDILWNENGMDDSSNEDSSIWQDENARRVILLAEENGFRWGGRYSGTTDPMHFEVMLTPAQVKDFNFDGSFSTSGGGGGGGEDTDFNIYYENPGQDPLSTALEGKRAWINDVPLWDSIDRLRTASLRDMQSAPNGDFVSFFPDRFGIWSRGPAVKVRDIEVTDFKLSISEENLVTHVAVWGDTGPPGMPVDWDILETEGVVTVDNERIFKLLLGLDPKKNYEYMGDYILKKFGIRPMGVEMREIQNHTWEFYFALHKFMEAWSNQYLSTISTTFLPEVYPGMRIEFVDHDISVYVAGVTHEGSRTDGFRSRIVVNSPMVKRKGKWVLLPTERAPIPIEKTKEEKLDSIDYNDAPAVIPVNSAGTKAPVK